MQTMQKFKRTSKHILSMLLALVMAMTLLPAMPLAAEASAGDILDLSYPPASGGAWERWAGMITYHGAGPLTIRGSSSTPYSITVSSATRIYIEDNTTINAGSGAALTVPSNSVIHGLGSNITIDAPQWFNVAISTVGNITITGTLGDLSADGNVIDAEGSVTISGTIGSITGLSGIVSVNGGVTISGNVGTATGNPESWAFIRAAGNVVISGTVGDIINFTTGILGERVRISGSIGNIVGYGTLASDGIIAPYDIVIDGSIDSISHVGVGIATWRGGIIRLNGTIGRISAMWIALDTWDYGGIHINAPIEVSGGTSAFNRQPFINFQHIASLSNNPGGFYYTTGSPYVWNENHRWVQIKVDDDAPDGDSGWRQDVGGNWWFAQDGGTWAVGWEIIDGDWHHFTEDGILQTGWQNIGGVWYYFQPFGAMQTGWGLIDGDWYYFQSGGAMQTGWVLIDEVWYYFRPYGTMQTGWALIDEVWYFFQPSGAMQKGWALIGGAWYYFQTNGAMATGWLLIEEAWHLFDDSGAWLGEEE